MCISVSDNNDSRMPMMSQVPSSPKRTFPLFPDTMSSPAPKPFQRTVFYHSGPTAGCAVTETAAGTIYLPLLDDDSEGISKKQELSQLQWKKPQQERFLLPMKSKPFPAGSCPMFPDFTVNSSSSSSACPLLAKAESEDDYSEGDSDSDDDVSFTAAEGQSVMLIPCRQIPMAVELIHAFPLEMDVVSSNNNEAQEFSFPLLLLRPRVSTLQSYADVMDLDASYTMDYR